ncbi:lysophospholipid acyltransferase family protein [Aquabacterium sp. OR-4]|uniref:lysophospholipid acyltransferase family protein n=1 Tax=Aquabacterium sp. OR-4 TaxID=2978127 RepID=UPI0021B23948|nr:lysophospholipid acyltransferase family protein [Aquabacterium sp. OR-4]MDT7834421.1 lysophospholipid acyltransferase family protein [Aquabacterium sp. OR-4]
MTRAALASWRALRVLLHVLQGLLLVGLLFPRLPEARRHAHIGHWSRGLLRVLGLTVQVSGQARPGATLLIANHVSWLDIAALHAAVPQARFVSKADVRHWPLVGWLVAGAGTLFIERERKRDALRVVHAMAEALQAGGTVAVFPEGTTGPGPELLPFHANLLQAAIATATPIQPATLRYLQPGEAFSTAAQYIGETTLAQSIWRIASARGLQVQVNLLPAQATAHADRRALAEHLRGLISDHLARSAAG